MFTPDDERFMHLAIEKARAGIKTGQAPFGACIVRGGEVVVCEHNAVWDRVDITAHAEVHAIREACRKLDTVDLSSSTIYTTTEPCPMCFSAIHWAHIDRIVYGAEIADAVRAGFNELTISCLEMKRLGGSTVEVEGGCLTEECLALFEEWFDSGNEPY